MVVAAGPSLDDVMAELKAAGSEKFKATFVRHGVPADLTYGVSNADLKSIATRIRNRQDLAYELYDTGIMDAMYLAGIVAKGSLMDRDTLNKWVKATDGLNMIAEYTVAWVTTESPYARELALEWIESPNEKIASSGWCTYAGMIATQPDDQLDLEEIRSLMQRVVREIHTSPNRVKLTMNGFVICVGAYVALLLEDAKQISRAIGKISVDMGDTACRVPSALDDIEKIESMGRVGKKRKTIRC
jgi:3-methyladenine DNA glycosylase AlkD